MKGIVQVKAQYTIPGELVDDTVVWVGADLWTKLGLPPVQEGEEGEDAFVSVLSDKPTMMSLDSSPLTGLTCRAVHKIEVTGLQVSASGTRAYPNIFNTSTHNSGSVLISRTIPVTLKEVIISPLSSEAYAWANEGSLFQSWANEKKLMRYQQTLVHDAQPDPQLPAYISTNMHPSVVATVQRQHLKYRVDMSEPVQQGIMNQSTKFILLSPENDDALSDAASVSTDNESGWEMDGVEIDEGFLANPIDGLVQPEAEVDFKPKVLDAIVSLEEDHHTIYIRTSDLGRLGILNGDWAIARSTTSTPRRLVRVQVREDGLSAAGTMSISPILQFNIYPELQTPNIEGAGLISVVPGPFGSSRPSIPTASAIVVARVSAPVTTNKAYSKACLQGLKAYLQSTTYLAKQGDIFCVPVGADKAYQTEDSIGDDQGFDSVILEKRKNEVAYFIITNIEYDVKVKNDQHGALDHYAGSTMGEFGCWIDSSATRIVQSGVEHSWIPALGTYFDLDHDHSEILYSQIVRQNSNAAILGPSSPFKKLHAVASAALAKNAVEYNLDLSVLLKGARGIGKLTVTRWVAHQLGMHVMEVNCYDLIGPNESTTEGTLRARFEKAADFSPCIFVLRHLEAFSQSTQAPEPGKETPIVNVVQECITAALQSWKVSGFPIIVVGTTSVSEKVPNGILSAFKHEVAFEAPGEPERYEILKCLTATTPIAPDVSLSNIAVQTAALVASDITSLVSRAKVASVRRALGDSAKLHDVLTAGLWLTASDFDLALSKARATYSQSIGAPSIPKVSWDDVGGLVHAKTDILDTIQLPLDHPELFAGGLKKRSGILLYGPPGTGKTLLAKAVATSCSLNFFSVKGPELLNMYIGESEANVRRVFQRARDAKPCVIFFDELDSVAPKRGNTGDSGGVMDRIVSQLLAELDGMAGGEGTSDVFVIGATNRPDLLDPALLRPGRFDRMIYLGVSDTHQAQYDILEALTRKFRLDPHFDLRAFADLCPFNYTGADFYALCADALLNAISRKVEELEAKLVELNKQPPSIYHDHPYPLTPQYYLAEMATQEDITVLVTQTDFEMALRMLVPSVSVQEMGHYKQVQQRFSQGSKEGEQKEKVPEEISTNAKGKGKSKQID